MLLEDACHQLYLSAGLDGSDCGPSYERYSAAIRELRKHKDEVQKLQSGIVVLEQILTFTAATLADASTNPLFTSITSQVSCMNEEKKGHVSHQTLFIAHYTCYLIILGNKHP